MAGSAGLALALAALGASALAVVVAVAGAALALLTKPGPPRLVSTQPEVEWDDTEQEWMRARTEWREEHICPLCGWPREVCQAPETEWAVEALLPTRCHVTTAIRRAQKDYSKQHGANPEGLLWGARLRGSADGDVPEG